MVIRLGYKTSPNMMGIQEGYNKNFHMNCIEYYEKFGSLWLFWDMKWRKYSLEATIKLLFIYSYHDKCLLFILELY